MIVHPLGPPFVYHDPAYPLVIILATLSMVGYNPIMSSKDHILNYAILNGWSYQELCPIYLFTTFTGTTLSPSLPLSHWLFHFIMMSSNNQIKSSAHHQHHHRHRQDHHRGPQVLGKMFGLKMLLLRHQLAAFAFFFFALLFMFKIVLF